MARQAESRKFYKTTVTIEIIGEEPWKGELDDLEYDITEGHFSGLVRASGLQVLTPKEVVSELRYHGTDPRFFDLDDDGNDIEDNYDFDVEPFTLVRVTLDCSPVEDEEN